VSHVVIKFDGVSNVFPEWTRAVDDVSFEIFDGECIAFVGPSGCGKTTTVKLLNRLVRMDLLSRAPKAADALNVLTGKISDDAMAALNYTVDGKKQEAEEVVKNFLKSQGLVK